jgi:hypothetical protein
MDGTGLARRHRRPHGGHDEYRAAYVRAAGREWDAERTDMVSDLLPMAHHAPRWYARRLGELEAQHDKAVLRTLSKA